MKKIIFSIFALSLIALCCSMNLHAQSSETDLDQAELMKQFVGKWITEIGEDSTVIWEIIPFAKGYETNLNWQAKGETYSSRTGIMGFTGEYRKVNWYILYSNGMIGRYLGEFVSDNKLIFKRFNFDHTNVFTSYEIDFITPDKYKVIAKSKGIKETWDDAEVTEYIYTRAKK